MSDIPTLGPLMPMEAYETLITKDGMYFEKFLRLVAIVMFKILGKLSKEELNKITCFEAEILISYSSVHNNLSRLTPRTMVNLLSRG